MKRSTILTAALVAGIFAGGKALAEEAKKTDGGGDQAAAEKNQCKGKKDSCKGKKKKNKNSCKGKDACSGKDEKPAEAAPAEKTH